MTTLPKECHSDIAKEQGYENILNALNIHVTNQQYNDLFMEVVLPEGWQIKRNGGYWSYLLDEKERERANMFQKCALWDRDAFLNFTKRFSLTSEIPDYDVKAFKEQPQTIQDGYEIVLEDVSPEKYHFRDDHTIELLDGLDEDSCVLTKGRIKRQIKKPKYIQNPAYHPLQQYEKYSQPFHFDVVDHDKTVLFSSSIVQTEFAYSSEKHWEFYNHRDELAEKARQECLNWLAQHYPDWLNPLAYWD